MENEQKLDFLKLQILKSIGVNFPILKETGYVLTKPILLVVNSGQLPNAISIFRLNEKSMLFERMKDKQLLQVMTSLNSGFAIYPYCATTKGNDFMKQLVEIMRTGMVFGKQISAPILIISEEIPSGNNLQEYFTIYTEENFDKIEISYKDVVPDDSQISVVFDKINEHCLESQTQQEKVMNAAVCFLYPILSQNGKKELLHQYFEVVAKLIENDEMTGDNNKVGEEFIFQLYRWQEQIGFTNIHQLPDLSMKCSKNMEKCVFYDEEFVYVKDKLFKNICGELLQIYASDILKKKLLEENIIVPDGARTYTAKMGYRNIAGQYCRERMIRFDRKKLQKIGELDFVETCLDGKENGKC